VPARARYFHRYFSSSFIIISAAFSSAFLGGLRSSWRGTQFFLVAVLDWGQVDLSQEIEQGSSSCLIGGFLAGFQALFQAEFRGVFFNGNAGH